MDSDPGQTPGDVEAREAVYGRRVDVLHRCHGWNDTWPTAEEQAYAAGGRLLFEGWESRVFGGATMCWADIATGVHDAAIDAQADMGSAEEFKAAWRHIVERGGRSPPTSSGCCPSWATTRPGRGRSTRATTWSTGWPGTLQLGQLHRPGPRHLAQPRAVARPMYAHLDAVGSTKPRMLGEYGSHDDRPWAARSSGCASSRRPSAWPCRR